MAQSEAMDTFVNNLKLAMFSAGLKQRDLCERTGILQPNISSILSGKDVRISTAQKIAEAVGYSLCDMLNPSFQPKSPRKSGRKPISA